jgi:hypothetical protein
MRLIIIDEGVGAAPPRPLIKTISPRLRRYVDHQRVAITRSPSWSVGSMLWPLMVTAQHMNRASRAQIAAVTNRIRHHSRSTKPWS